MSATATQQEQVMMLVEKYKQWLFGATKPRTEILPKEKFTEHGERNYSLKNRQYVKYLQYEDQTFGINLGWTDDATNETGNKVARWFFARPGSDDSPIRYGERLALGNGGGASFLKFEERTIGINLGWSDQPVYEWQIFGGKIGAPVHTQEWVVIFNLRSEEGEPLIFFDRTAGGDIGWPSSKTWPDQIEELAWPLIKKGAIEYLKSL